MHRTAFRSPTASPTTSSMVNARDGGINGVKIIFEECETGYATDRGVECYERLKGKGPTGAAYFSPLFDRHHLRADREGAERQDPAASPWATAAPTRRDGARVQLELPAARHLLDGGRRRSSSTSPRRRAASTSSRARRSRCVYHDSPYGKEPIAAARERCRRCTASSFMLIPVPRPGVEQKSHVAADPPEPAGLRPAVGLGRHELRPRSRRRGNVDYPRDKMYRRVVVGRRARRACRPATAPRATTALMLQHRRRQVRRARGHREVRLSSQGKSLGQARRGRPGALQPRPDQLDARRRGDPHRAGASSATSR